MNTWQGQRLRISIFGESHGRAVGCVIDGLPAGYAPDMDAVRYALSLRRPASGGFTTQRDEKDDFEILSGMKDGVLCGSPLCVVFGNKDTRSSDYNENIMRPSHADLAAFVKYQGNCDLRGGGHFSARLTAPLVFCGAICDQLLQKRKIFTAAAITAVGKAQGKSFYDTCQDEALMKSLDTAFPLIDPIAKVGMEEELRSARENSDSVGGCVECCMINLPMGLGEPFFDSVESSIARLAFSVPAVKGIEFGRGFKLSEMRGSCANDEYNAQAIKNKMCGVNNCGDIAYNNNAGGIIGGLTSSMPLIFKVAFKPIPSIGQPQRSVDMRSYEPVIVKTEGRHDVCAALRGAFAVKSIACICMFDFLSGAGL